MRRMYHECNLVHGDLSEYNLLWYRNRPIIIDVSQSVEHAHPFANDFLKKDIQNVNDFFGKREVSTLSNYHLFQFITATKENLITTIEVYWKEMKRARNELSGNDEKLGDIVLQMLASETDNPEKSQEITEMKTNPVNIDDVIISDEPIDPHLQSNPSRLITDFPVKILNFLLSRFLEYQEYQHEISAKQTNYESNESEIQEAVFLQSYIPSSLNEFSNPVVERNKLEKGQREVAYTSAINQMLAAPLQGKDDGDDSNSEEEEGQVHQDGDESGSEDEESDDESDNESDSNSSSDDKKKKKKYRRRLPGTDSNPEERKQIKDERKEAKRLAKELAALKRTQKVPKHVKKRAVKNGKKK